MPLCIMHIYIYLKLPENTKLQLSLPLPLLHQRNIVFKTGVTFPYTHHCKGSFSGKYCQVFGWREGKAHSDVKPQ